MSKKNTEPENSKLSKIFNTETLSIFVAILIGFIIGSVILIIAGFNPLEVYSVLIKGIFEKPTSISWTIINSTTIIITGLSVVFAFKTGLFNIGAEGQFIIGSIAASFTGYYLVSVAPLNALPNFLHPIIVIIAAMIAGGLYGGLVGLFKAKFGIHEVLSSIMLNWIALHISNLYIAESGFKKDAAEAVYEVQTSAMIKLFPELKSTPDGLKQIITWIETNISNPETQTHLRDLIIRTDINFGFLIAVAAAIIVWIILNKTTLGYSLKAVGFNKDAAEFAGIDVNKNMFLSMAIAGALSGLAGAMYITGTSPHRIDMLAMHDNHGFNGLSVALIGGVHPIGTIFAGLFYSALNFGSTKIQQDLGAPTEIINIVIGIVVALIAVKTFLNIKIDFFREKFFANKNDSKKVENVSDKNKKAGGK